MTTTGFPSGGFPSGESATLDAVAQRVRIVPEVTATGDRDGDDPDTSPRPARPRPRWVPTSRLVVVAALVGVAAVVASTAAGGLAVGLLLLAGDAVLVGLAVLDAARFPADSDVRGTRRLPPLLSLRCVETMTVTVDNVSARTLRGRLRCAVPDAFAVPVDTVDVTVPADGWAEVPFRLVGLRRGRHALAPCELRARSTLGLVERRYHVCVAQDAVVAANLRAARQLEFALRRRRRDDAGSRATPVLGIGTDFDSLRDYRPDDDVRLVDWKATARRGTPVTRQYRIERHQNVLLVVDTGRLSAAPLRTDAVAGYEDLRALTGRGRTGVHPDDVELRRLDVALNAAAAMAYVCSAREDRVGMVAFDDRLRVRLAPSRTGRDVMLASMAALEPRLVESDYAAAFRSAAAMKRSLVVVFTDVGDDVVAAPLLASVDRLLRHHLVVVASVADPDAADLLATVPSDAETAVRQAVALDLDARRRTTVASLTARGVVVVDAPPSEFSAGLVDAYLRVKTAARL